MDNGHFTHRTKLKDKLRTLFAQIPNLLSTLRGVCAPLFVWAALTEHWRVAFGLLVYAIVSDLIDGPIARKLDHATGLGTRLDHTADFAFAFLGLLALSLHDENLVPLALPLLQLLAFGEYAYTGPQTHRSLIPSRLGRYNGILYFVVVATITTQLAFELDWVPINWIYGFCWLLTATTILSIAIRIITRFRKSRGTN